MAVRKPLVMIGGVVRGLPAGDSISGGPTLQGDTGPAGPQGPAGADGGDGSSAYHVAVANGFIGTEAQWLASLVGPQGAQGIQGPKGDTGADGATGAAGTTSWSGITDIPVGVSALNSQASLAGTAIDLSVASLFTKTISGATTFTLSNVPPAGTISSFSLILTAGGSATVKWWPNIKWQNNTPPVLSTTGQDILGFFTHDGGTKWYGFIRASALTV